MIAHRTPLSPRTITSKQTSNLITMSMVKVMMNDVDINDILPTYSSFLLFGSISPSHKLQLKFFNFFLLNMKSKYYHPKFYSSLHVYFRGD